jgi:hypothetical protein
MGDMVATIPPTAPFLEGNPLKVCPSAPIKVKAGLLCKWEEEMNWKPALRGLPAA